MSSQNKINQKQQARKSNSNLSSEQFIYNPDVQRHIGKRTGNYFYRANPQQHYDGFPRFSQYYSCRDTQSGSLAPELENNNSNHISISNIQRQSGKQLSKEPFVVKESPIITPIDNQVSSRKIQNCLLGFGEFDISTIKRRSSAIRPSQIKSYKDLLNDLETDEFKQFIFNEDEIKQITQSAKKQMQQKQLQNQKQMEKKKRKKQARVSFKQTHIIIQDWSNGKSNNNSVNTNSYKNANSNNNTINANANTNSNAESNSNKNSEFPKQKAGQGYYKQTIVYQSKFKQIEGQNSFVATIKRFKQEQQQKQLQKQKQQAQTQTQSQYLPTQQQYKQQNIINAVKQQQFQFQSHNFVQQQQQNQYQKQDNHNLQQNYEDNNQRQNNLYSNKQLPSGQQPTQPQKIQSKKITNKQKRKNKKKEKRITDNPSQSDRNQYETTMQQAKNIKKSEQRKIKQSKQEKKPQKLTKSVTLKENTNRDENKNIERQKKQNQSKKLKTKSQPNQYLEQLTSEPVQESSSTKRYPKRTRIKPLQYWQSEKVYYKAGKALGIQNANLDFRDLLNVTQIFEHQINVNFHTHDIEIDLIIPAKRQIHSQGIKQQYQNLQILINFNKHKVTDNLQIYFDDGLRTLKLNGESQEQFISVPSLRYFQIINKSLSSIHLVLKLKVKIQ